jgi:ribosomal protein S18 acetylase RimI-like enzyme
MQVRRAEFDDAPRVMALIDRCRKDMQAGGSPQWDEIYPNLGVVEADARQGTLFIIDDIAAVCLNEVQPPEYAALPWCDQPGRVLVVHRLCVDPDHRGKGVAKTMMDFAESYAAENGHSSIRLDTWIGNARALDLYRKRGYELIGQVVFARRPLRFDCFEKRISLI